MKVLIIRHAQSQNNIVQAQVTAYLDFNPYFEIWVAERGQMRSGLPCASL